MANMQHGDALSYSRVVDVKTIHRTRAATWTCRSQCSQISRAFWLVSPACGAQAVSNANYAVRRAVFDEGVSRSNTGG